MNAALGKETIDTFNTSDTRGNSPSYGTNFQKLGHELMSQDELAVLDGGKCILGIIELCCIAALFGAVLVETFLDWCYSILKSFVQS